MIVACDDVVMDGAEVAVGVGEGVAVGVGGAVAVAAGVGVGIGVPVGPARKAFRTDSVMFSEPFWRPLR